MSGLLRSPFVPHHIFVLPSQFCFPTGRALCFWTMFNSRDSVINPDVLYFSQVPVPGHGQEIFWKRVASPGPALSVWFPPVDTKDLRGSPEPRLLLDSGKRQCSTQAFPRKGAEVNVPSPSSPSCCRCFFPLLSREKQGTFPRVIV